jgi:hypothetical protein
VKILRLSFCLLCFVSLALQAQLPVIRANSNQVTIRDGGTVIKGVWIAEPQNRPDRYRTIRSDAVRKVTFYTDLDSIAFTLQPGEKKDFVILLNGKDSCFTEVSTLNGTQVVRESGGIFMRPKVWLPIVAFLLMVAGFSVRYRKNLRLLGLLSLGIWIPVVFWIGTIIGGYIHGSYNHFTQVVSEIGAVGTRSEVFMSALTVLLSFLSLYFIAGLTTACRRLKISALPTWTIFSFTIMFFFTGMFPMGNPLHVITGPIFLFLNLGTLLAIVLWRGQDLRFIQLVSLLSLLLLSLIALKFVAPLQMHYPGLIQRFSHLGWSVWFAGLSVGMWRLVHRQQQKNSYSPIQNP